MSILNVVSGNFSPVGTSPTSAVNSGNSSLARGAVAKPPPPPPKGDTVRLSASAQAKSLKLIGETPAQISTAMSIDVKTVDGYLGVTVPTPPVATTPASTSVALPAPAASTSAATARTATAPTASAPSGKIDIKV